MPLGLRLTVDARRASKKLQKVEAAVAVTPMLEAIGEAGVKFSRQLFATRGREVGGWRPLAKSTVAVKGHSRPLVLTGELRDSITYKVIPGARVQIGTDDPKAAWHHYGTRPYRIEPVRAKVLSFVTESGRQFRAFVNHPGLPARPILPREGQMKQIAKDAARDHIAQVKKYGQD